MIVTPARTMRDIAPPSNRERLDGWKLGTYREQRKIERERDQKKEPQPCDRKL